MRNPRKTKERKAPPPTTADRQPAPKRILVVDDDPGVRESLLAVLREEGYQVLSAGGGLQALSLAASAPPDLVLLDLNLPGQNGWDTFERFSTENPLLPVVIITGRPNQLFTACNAGVGALLEKPLDIPILLKTIKTLLAEPAEVRLARIAGHNAPFHYLSQGGQYRITQG